MHRRDFRVLIALMCLSLLAFVKPAFADDQKPAEVKKQESKFLRFIDDNDGGGRLEAAPHRERPRLRQPRSTRPTNAAGRSRKSDEPTPNALPCNSARRCSHMTRRSIADARSGKSPL